MRVLMILVLVGLTADAAQAFRWPFYYVHRHRGHHHYAVPAVPHDCTKIRAARRDITDENWNEVDRTLTPAQRRFIEDCMAPP